MEAECKTKEDCKIRGWYDEKLFQRVEEIFVRRYQTLDGGGTIAQISASSYLKDSLLPELAVIVASYAVSSIPALDKLTVHTICRTLNTCSDEEKQIILQAFNLIDLSRKENFVKQRGLARNECTVRMVNTDDDKEKTTSIVVCLGNDYCFGDVHIMHGPHSQLLLNKLFEYVSVQHSDDLWKGRGNTFFLNNSYELIDYDGKFNLFHTTVADMEKPYIFRRQWIHCCTIVRIIACIFHLLDNFDPRFIVWVIRTSFDGEMPPFFTEVNTCNYEVFDELRSQRREAKGYRRNLSCRYMHRFKPRKSK